MISNPILFAVICMLVGFLLAFAIIGILVVYFLYDCPTHIKQKFFGGDFYEP